VTVPAGPGTTLAPRPTLLVATRSRHKLAELRDLLHLEHAELVDLDDSGIADEADETGATFAANAALKARFYARRSGLPTLADDSGLEVDALGGGPGVRTRRYAGEQATDEQNNAKLLAALHGLPPERRPAWRAAGDAGARDVRGTDRHRAARHERVRLRPHLRARVGATRRRDRRGVAGGAQAGRLTPGPRRPPHGAAPRAARLLMTQRSGGTARRAPPDALPPGFSGQTAPGTGPPRHES
jgi:hypothetical protein